MIPFKKRESLTALFWIIAGLIIAVWSATFPFGEWKAPGPGFLPFSLSLILACLGIILFYQAVKNTARDEPASIACLIPAGPAGKRVALTIAGLFLSAILLDFLGFVVTMFLLLLFLTRIIEPPKWSVAVFYALASAAGVFVLFRVLLKTSLPRGFLGF